MKDLNIGSGVARRSQRLQQQQQVSEQESEGEEAANSGESEEEEEGNEDVEEEEDENAEEGNGEEEDAEPNDEDDEMDIDDEFGGDGKKGKSKSSDGRGTPKGLKKPSTKIEPYSPPSGGINMEDMIQNTMMYLLLQHQKKTPIKRPDIVKHALDGQVKAFKEVIDKITAALDEKFGIDLVGVEESKGRAGGYISYILVSKYRMKATHCTVQFTQDQELKKAVLVIILCLIFMIGHEIDEEVIKKTLERLNITVVKKEDDLRRFLKQEYVSTLYLKIEETKDTDTVKATYEWGLRAEKEFPKAYILNFVADLFPDKRMEDFTPQYNRVLEEERDTLEKLRAEKAHEESNAPAPVVTEAGEGEAEGDEAEEMEQDENEEEQEEEENEEQGDGEDQEMESENEEGSRNSVGSRAPSPARSSSIVRGSVGSRSGSCSSRSSYTSASTSDTE